MKRQKRLEINKPKGQRLYLSELRSATPDLFMPITYESEDPCGATSIRASRGITSEIAPPFFDVPLPFQRSLRFIR